MKLGATYNGLTTACCLLQSGAHNFCGGAVFDSEELLEASIRSIRSNVDYINIIYQKVGRLIFSVRPSCPSFVHGVAGVQFRERIKPGPRTAGACAS